MMDNELFELCKEVYKRTGWGSDQISGPNQDMNKPQLAKRTEVIHPDKMLGPSDVLEGTYLDEVNISTYESYPIYTSDYLLEMLPKSLTTIYGKAYPLSPQVMASGDYYYAMYKHDMTGPNSEEANFEVEGETPLKALLRLVIALDKAGEIGHLELKP